MAKVSRRDGTIVASPSGTGPLCEVEEAVFRSVRDLLVSIDWSSSDDRAVFIPANLAPRQSSNRFRSGIVLVLGYLRPYCYLRDTGTLRNRIKISLASKPLHLQPKPKSGDEGEESCVEDPVAQMDPVGRSLAK